jgi:hypothetical protein
MANDYALQTVQAQLSDVSFAEPPSVLHMAAALTGRSMHPRSTLIRRGFFIWVKLFVYDRQAETTVMLRLPVPVPLLGLLFRHRFSPIHALEVATLLEGKEREDLDMWNKVQHYLDSLCGVELLRIRDARSTVVIGLE